MTEAARESNLFKDISDLQRRVADIEFKNVFSEKYRPAFRAVRITTHYGPIANEASAMLFNSILPANNGYDYQSNYNVNTGKFTAPIKGAYRFYTSFLGQGTYAVSNFVGPAFYKNTTRVAISGYKPGTGNSNSDVWSGGTDIELDVNETLEVRVSVSSGSFTMYGAADFSWFEGSLITPYHEQ